MKTQDRELLDNLQQIKQQDRHRMLEILERFGEQIEAAVEIGERAEIPFDRSAIQHILISGLGGSAIGGDFVRAYLGRNLSVPFHVNRDYSVPNFVGPSTLAFLCSYSGNTEETLSSFRQAREAGAQVICLTSNGELGRLGQEHGCPVVKIPGGYPPRTALGYSAMPLLRILSRLGFAPDLKNEIQDSLDLVRTKIRSYGPGSPLEKNSAKELAYRVHGHLPLIYGSQDRLEVVAVRWRGQFSENGKNLAYSSVLPEMNHNEIVGWNHPRELLALALPIFLRDREDHPRVQMRMEFTRDLLTQKAGTVLEYWTEGETWLERLWSLILLGDYASIYLAFLNGEDPTPVEVIESLKERLKQS